MESSLQAMLERAFTKELRGPLPPHLHAAREQGFNDYFKVATRIATRAATHRAERELALAKRAARRAAATPGGAHPRS
jgi:hypothetical protein